MTRIINKADLARPEGPSFVEQFLFSCNIHTEKSAHFLSKNLILFKNHIFEFSRNKYLNLWTKIDFLP